jgi:hypothetical protein
VTGGSRLAGVDVSNNDDVDMWFILGHCECILIQQSQAFIPTEA